MSYHEKPTRIIQTTIKDWRDYAVYPSGLIASIHKGTNEIRWIIYDPTSPKMFKPMDEADQEAFDTLKG